jgi:hypothetical protein
MAAAAAAGAAAAGAAAGELLGPGGLQQQQQAALEAAQVLSDSDRAALVDFAQQRQGMCFMCALPLLLPHSLNFAGKQAAVEAAPAVGGAAAADATGTRPGSATEAGAAAAADVQGGSQPAGTHEQQQQQQLLQQGSMMAALGLALKLDLGQDCSLLLHQGCAEWSVQAAATTALQQQQQHLQQPSAQQLLACTSSQCCGCGQKGASLHCDASGCSRSFHLPCVPGMGAALLKVSGFCVSVVAEGSAYATAPKLHRQHRDRLRSNVGGQPLHHWTFQTFVVVNSVHNRHSLASRVYTCDQNDRATVRSNSLSFCSLKRVVHRGNPKHVYTNQQRFLIDMPCESLIAFPLCRMGLAGAPSTNSSCSNMSSSSSRPWPLRQQAKKQQQQMLRCSWSRPTSSSRGCCKTQCSGWAAATCHPQSPQKQQA